MSILGLTMVPSELIGSPQAVTRFRKNWVMGLQTLEKSLATSQEKVGFHSASQPAHYRYLTGQEN